jgi:uroporphyrinogen decarboxylase
MRDFTPDYRNIVRAARNIRPERTPIYEHLISGKIMEKILGREFVSLYGGDRAERLEFFRSYCEFFRRLGYDTVSFECCASSVFPGSGALGARKPGVIRSSEDFAKYPWAEIPKYYFKRFAEDFELLREAMPPGMKAVGGVGNGVFECAEDIVGYVDLCYISADDPELYGGLFREIGGVIVKIWEEFLKRYGDIFCVCRFGDDLGFRTQTLLPPRDIREHIVPWYTEVVRRVHACGKPFLLHCCGNIFDVMEDLIRTAGIDAKHSNEDQIAPFSEWVDRYGDRIGLFGGVDMGDLCVKSEREIRERVLCVMRYSAPRCGIALGSGNSIPDYVPVEGYLAMVEAARKFRGERP